MDGKGEVPATRPQYAGRILQQADGVSQCCTEANTPVEDDQGPAPAMLQESEITLNAPKELNCFPLVLQTVPSNITAIRPCEFRGARITWSSCSTARPQGFRQEAGHSQSTTAKPAFLDSLPAQQGPTGLNEKPHPWKE